MSARRPPVRWLVLVAILSAASSAMCGKAPGGDHGSGVQATPYSAIGVVKSIDFGVVKSIDTAQKGILIKHEDIPGYMKPMTMLFDLRDLEQVKGIAPGDSVAFTFVDEGGGRLVVQTIRKTP